MTLRRAIRCFRFSRRRTILVDASGSLSDQHIAASCVAPSRREAVSRYLWPRGFKHIAVVTLTQANPDHIAGGSPQQEQLEKLATAHGAQVIHELRGNYFDVDGAHGNFLWPQTGPEGVAASAAKNDDSLIFRAVFGEGGATVRNRQEQNARARYSLESTSAELRYDVLAIAHHGSKNSTT